MLKYYYGVMTSGKSASLLMSAYQKEKDGHNILILKPFDKRDKNLVSSRVGLQRECVTFDKDTNLIRLVADLDISYKYIYIDECQFLTKEQVYQLWKLSTLNIEIMCFGLKTNFKNQLFESVESLMVYADKIKSIQPPCGCKYCSGVATTHLLVINNQIELDLPEQFEGDTEGATRFECVCQKCWHEKTSKVKSRV